MHGAGHARVLLPGVRHTMRLGVPMHPHAASNPQPPARLPPRRLPALRSSKSYNVGELTTLTTWLLREELAGNIDIDLFAVLTSIASACKQISALVRISGISLDGVCVSHATAIV